MTGFQYIGIVVRQSRPWVFLVAVVLYVLATIFSNPLLQSWSPWISALTLLVAFPSSSRTGKILTLCFLVGGLALMISQGSGFLVIMSSFGSMLNLLSLFTAVPLLAVPVQVGDYRESVEQILTNKPLSPKGFQIIVNAFSYLLSILMNVGSVPMMYSITSRLGERFGQKNPNRFLIPSIISGYTMPLLWSPVAAVLAAVVSETKIHWAAIFPVSFALSLVGLGLSAFWWKVESSVDAVAATRLDDDILKEPSKGRKLWEIGVGISVFVILLVAAQSFFDWPIGVVLALLAFPFAFLWTALIHKTRAFRRSMRGYRRGVDNLRTTFAVFTGAGFFVEALGHSGYTHVLDNALLNVSHAVGPVGFLAVIPWLILLLALLGLHPVVSIALLSGVLHPSLLHLSPLWLSVGLLGGGVGTFILSPFMATLTIAGVVSGERPAAIMRWTAGYALVFLSFCDAVACAGQWLF